MAEQTQWAPRFNEKQTRLLVKDYRQSPNQYDVESLRNHASYYNVPFYEGDFSILDAVKQAAGGFIEGFTTLKTIDPPDNEWEAVARSVGHLAGFAPGILSAPAKVLGLHGAAKFLAGKKGIPLYLSEKYITPKVAKYTSKAIQASTIGRTGAVSEVGKFLLSPKAKHIAEGAFNLGTASGLSAWQSGVDDMMGSFFSGAVAGGVFRGIGNQINLKDPKAEKFARGLAGSLFMGVPASVRGASTPEQVYEYLMGAYFGGSEKPWTEARAGKFIGKMRENKDALMMQEFDPKKQEGWKELEPEVQPLVEKMANKVRGETLEQHTVAAYALAESMGQLKKLPGEKEADIPVRISKNYNTVKKIASTLKQEGEPKKDIKPEKPKNFIITTGKSGAEAFATEQADKRDLTTVQFRFPMQKQLFGAKKGRTEQITVGRQHFAEANVMLEKAVDNLRQIEISSGKKPRASIATLPEYIREALRRDAVVIKTAADIFTVDKIADDFKTVAGKSKYAVQMAIDAGRNVSVFDKRFGPNWLSYNYEKEMFIPRTTPPEISDRIAFFGKEKLEPVEKLGINQLYQQYDKIGFKEQIKAESLKKEDTYGFETELFDIGEASSTPLDTKMNQFVTKFLKPKIKKDIKDPMEVDNKLIEYSNKFGDLAINFIEPGSKTTKSNEWADAVQAELPKDVKLPQTLRNKMRQWLKVQNDSSPMRFITGDGERFNIADSKNPYTLAGKKKFVMVPNTPHEDLYMKLKGIIDKPKEGIYSILDHMTIKGVDTDITGMKPEELSQHLSKAIGSMDKKYGMHIYSGLGDKNRIVFMKYHPNSNTVKLPKMPTGYYRLIRELYGMSKLQHDKAMKSIMAYEADLVGLPLSEIVNKPGFINDAVKTNKRTQIWFTNGFKGDKEFLKNPKNVGKLNLSENDNFTASLISDPEKVKNILGKLNTELPQGVDGAIIMSQAEVDAINLDAGVPYSGQNKSFIIMPSTEGTMLMKYMIHKAGPAMSKAMNKAGTNMLIMNSAVKQRGKKTPGDYDLIGDRKKGYELILKGGAKNIFEINPENLRYNHSVVQDEGLFGVNQHGRVRGMKIVKQLMTNPHPDMHTPTKTNVIGDFFKTHSENSFKGDKKINNLVNNYLNNPNEQISNIVENSHLIGIPEILKLFKKPGNDRLSAEILKEILNVNKESVNELRASGEESGTNAEEVSKMIHDFSGTADNIIKYASTIKDGYPLFFDKYTNQYVTKAIHKYIADRVLSPRVLNSLEARMRPYDKDLLITFPEFNNDNLAMKKHNRKSDEIFMLGDLYEELAMFTQIPGLEKTTLGKLWRARKNPKYKAYKQDFKDIFEAISVRVPQDSPSGAQVLKFIGFTGIKDHGILQHSRVMEAEGGADLDGDASFVYFGGMKENGSGAGMKNSFKEMYKGQKEEFYTGTGKDRKIIDAKDTYRSEIVLNKDNIDVELKEMVSYVNNEGGRFPYMQYSPGVRLFSGLKAATGRNMMAPVVSMTQNMRAAWSSLLHSKNKFDTIEILPDKKGKNYRRIVRPKPANTEQALYSKALVNFTADPMNETGLISLRKMKTGLMNKYFTSEEQIFKGGEWKTVKLIPNTNIPRYKAFNDVNKAFFGRNWDKNRAWTPMEKMEKISGLEKYNSDEFTTILPKFGNLLKDTDLSLSIMERLNPKAIKDIYSNHEKKVKLSKMQDIYKQILGRKKLIETETPPIDFIFSEDLHRADMIENVSKLNDKDFFQLLDKYKVTYDRHEIKSVLTGKSVPSLITPLGKKEYLMQEHHKVSEYFSNALHNIVTLERIMDVYEKGDISNAEMHKIITFHEFIKKNHATRHHARSRRGEPFDTSEAEQVKVDKKIREFHQASEQVGVLKGKLDKKLPKSSLENRTKIMDQAQLDGAIKKFKESLSSESAKDMIDNLLIGSFRTPDLNKRITEWQRNVRIAKNPESKKLAQQIVDGLYSQASKTGTSQLAFDSNAINPKNMLGFLNAKNKYFLKAQTKLTKEDKVELEKFDKETDKFIPLADLKNAGIVQELNGYEGLKSGTLTQEQKDVVVKLTANLKEQPDINGKDLHEVLSGIYSEIDPEGIPKPLNKMTVNDFKLINNWFKFIKSGTFMQRLQSVNNKYQEASVQKRHTMQFPKTNSREQMKFHIKFLPAEGYFATVDGAPRGQIMKPTYYGEVMQNYIGRMQALSSGMTEKLQSNFRERFHFLNQAQDDGGSIWRVAVRKHERAQSEYSHLYEKYYESSLKNNKWEVLAKKKYTVELDGKRKVYTGEQLLEKTQEKLSGLMKEYHTFIVGKKGALKKYTTGWYDPSGKTQPILDYKTFIQDMSLAYRKNETLTMDIGFDGLRHMARSMTIDLLPITEYIGIGKFKGKKASLKAYNKLSKFKQKSFIPDREAQAEKYENLVIKSTGHREGYYPHLFNSNKELVKAFESERKKLEEEGLSREEYINKYERLIMKYKFRQGDWDFADGKFWDKLDSDVFDSLVEKQANLKDKADLKTVEARTGNMFTRGKEGEHMGGWIPEPEAVDLYIGNVVNAYYRQLSNIMSRHTLNTMKTHLTKAWVDKAPPKEKEDAKKLVKGWVNHWRMYAREAMGNPTIIPKDILNDPDMKISGTPYALFADNLIAEKIDNIRKKLNISKSSIPEELQKIDAYHVRRWGNLEGQFQLATLMTHPKTMINNIFGGTMHTFQSVGYEPLRKARNIEYLRTINPEFTSLEKVSKFVEELGVLPEMALHEFGLQKAFRSGKGLAFVKDLSKNAGSAKTLKDLNIVDLANKHGIGKALMEKASKFMTRPERMLRRDSFMAHYIKAWERFGGAIKDPKHPFLVEMAKKGVQATQFLYSAPYRPAFARSGLGKIMSRFQLWSWNAVRFRNDLRNQAKIYGFEPGTEAMKKFERTMRTDMFVLALSSVFMYSIFEQVLPAPWNWLQDTADWLFGDEKERDRAFFGTWPSAVAPLQMITPPIARFPISIIREFAEDDYNKLADYYSWTMFPFGRMIRDVAHPETGLIRNPMRFPEKVFGFPMIGLSKEAKKLKEQDYKAPTPGISKLKY